METNNLALVLSPKKIFTDYFPLELNWRVADFGCGTMAFFVIEAARQVGNKGQVYAIDVQKNVVTAVDNLVKNQGLYNVTTVWSDVEKIGATKIVPESLDAVLIVTTLFQMNNKDAAIKEALRLLKPGGKLLIIDWRTSNAPIAPPEDRLVSLSEIKNILTNNHIEIINEFSATAFHFGLCGQKPLANV
jgi:ubiquinone/menaquinone biosynthesis C-methylase UbiE